MNKLIFVYLCLITTHVLAEDVKPFVYDDHGKKDPLAPLVAGDGTIVSYDTQVTAADIILEGIVIDPKGNLAIINGKIVKVGDQVASYTVEKISPTEAELVNATEHLQVRMKKGGGS